MFRTLSLISRSFAEALQDATLWRTFFESMRWLSFADRPDAFTTTDPSPYPTPEESLELRSGKDYYDVLFDTYRGYLARCSTSPSYAEPWRTWKRLVEQYFERMPVLVIHLVDSTTIPLIACSRNIKANLSFSASRLSLARSFASA